MINCLVQDEGTIATRTGGAQVLPLANTEDGVFIAGVHFYKVGTDVYDAAGTALGITQTGKQLRVAAAPALGVTDDIVFFPEAMKKYYQGVVSDWGIQGNPDAAVAADAGG